MTSAITKHKLKIIPIECNSFLANKSKVKINYLCDNIHQSCKQKVIHTFNFPNVPSYTCNG